jgi:hypothetical protein
MQAGFPPAARGIRRVIRAFFDFEIDFDLPGARRHRVPTEFSPFLV